MAAPHGYSYHKDDYSKRLRRIEGQVRGIAKMIDEDKYCIDILTQVSAVNSALRSVALGLLEEHLNHCVTNAVSAGGSRDWSGPDGTFGSTYFGCHSYVTR
jgi:DNA-binding FrmR family transcriptional regulator